MRVTVKYKFGASVTLNSVSMITESATEFNIVSKNKIEKVNKKHIISIEIDGLGQENNEV